MLYLVGLGLHDEGDLSLKGLDALRKCGKVYLESYTSKFKGSLERLSELAGKEIMVLGRSGVEEDAVFIEEALEGDVCLLVCGDPMAATTHADLVLRARRKGVEVRVIHSSSIFSAIGECGLQLYKFGRTTTLAYPDGDYFPMSPYDVIRGNMESGLHTLVLLDVRSDEDRFMSVNEAVGLLLRMEGEKKEGVVTEDSMCLGVARLGGDAVIRYGKAGDLLNVDFRGPPHVLIIPGRLHFMEEEALKEYVI
ncbi:MAG: diphthine synthase [Candidatus Altiarchaeota archaeon]